MLAALVEVARPRPSPSPSGPWHGPQPGRVPVVCRRDQGGRRAAAGGARRAVPDGRAAGGVWRGGRQHQARGRGAWEVLCAVEGERQGERASMWGCGGSARCPAVHTRLPVPCPLPRCPADHTSSSPVRTPAFGAASSSCSSCRACCGSPSLFTGPPRKRALDQSGLGLFPSSRMAPSTGRRKGASQSQFCTPRTITTTPWCTDEGDGGRLRGLACVEGVGRERRV